MKYLIMILVVLFTTGCSMSPEEIELENKKLALMEKVATQPTLDCEAKCTYIDPRRNLATIFPKETNWADAFKEVGATTVRAAFAPTTIMGAVTYKAVDSFSDSILSSLANAGGNTTYTDSYNTYSQANQANTSSTINEANVTETTSTSTLTFSEAQSLIEDSYNDSSDNSQDNSNSSDNSDNSVDTPAPTPPPEVD